MSDLQHTERGTNKSPIKDSLMIESDEIWRVVHRYKPGNSDDWKDKQTWYAGDLESALHAAESHLTLDGADFHKLHTGLTVYLTDQDEDKQVMLSRETVYRRQ